MQKIKSIQAREIIDSRGNPTVEVDVILKDGSFGRASVPSGASTGSNEAIELRDNDKNRYGGKGVQKAIKNVNSIIKKALIGKGFDQRSLDNTLIALDGTKNKSRLGANAILGVSMAFAKASAICQKKTLASYFRSITKSKLPLRMLVPMMNIINGGKHAENSTDIQEFMIVPLGFKSFSEALRAGVETFHALKRILHSRKLATTVGDEGGFAPSLPNNEAALALVVQAINEAGYIPSTSGKPNTMAIALDVAATELYKDTKYELARDGKILTVNELITWYKEMVEKYPIISIEDGCAENDWSGFKLLTETLGKKIQLVGDDLFVTNIEYLDRGIKSGVANSILIKLNQIGTVSETIDTVNMATKSWYTSIISHRSGETEDSTIADFAVGTGAGQIKTGSLLRTDRIAKYNQLLRIEENLGKKAIYPGKSVF